MEMEGPFSPLIQPDKNTENSGVENIHEVEREENTNKNTKLQELRFVT